MSDNKFSWVHAFTDTALPPTTKLILHTICMFMNSRGEGAFPSIETLAEKSGLGVTAVKKHIAIAVDEGWLKKGKHGYAGQQWARNEYYVSYPEQNENAEKKAGRDAADLQNKVGHLATEGGSPDVKKVGREAATNIPVNK